MDYLKAVESFGFAFVNVKDGQQLGNRQQILKLLRQVKQLELAASLPIAV